MYRIHQRPSLLEITGLAGLWGQTLELFRAPVRDVLYRARRWHQEGIEIRGLQRLDDRLLRDIGIARADIRTVVKAALDAAEAKRSPSQSGAQPARVSLSDLGLNTGGSC